MVASWEQDDPIIEQVAPWEQADPVVTGTVPEQIGGAFVRGGMRLGAAIVDLPKHIVNQVKLLPMATMADEVLAERDPTKRAAKLDDMAKVEGFFNRVTIELGRAGEIHRQGQETILKNHPEWETEPPRSFADLLASPDKLVVALAESTPLLLGAGILTAAGAPQVGVMMMYASEGQEAYDRAKAANESDDVADDAYVVYGTVAAALENMQLRHIMKIGKGLWNQVLHRTAQKVGRRGAKALTMDIIKLASKESLEEVTQGEWGDITANIIYDEPFGPIGAHIDRRLQEAYIGWMMGVLPSGGSVVAAKTQQQRMMRKFTGKDSPLKTQQYAILTAENPGNRALGAEENAARNAELMADLRTMDRVPIPVEGRYGGPVENSFLVFGLTDEQALELGKKHGQESVLTPKGLVYQDGTVNPADLNKINYDPGQVDYYSTVNVGGRPIKFSIPINFETKEALVPEVEEPAPIEEKMVAHIGEEKVPKKGKKIFRIDAKLSDKPNSQVIGGIEYTIENGIIHISEDDGIYVVEKHRRKGIATALINKLRQTHPKMEIDFGPTTEEGLALIQSLVPAEPKTADETIGMQYGLTPEETNERLGNAELRFRELKTKEKRTKTENTELAFLKRNRKNIEALLDQDTQPIEKRIGKKKALALGHQIPERLGWTKEQRYAFNKKITNQESMKKMTPAQREQVVMALIKEAKAAGVEIDAPEFTPVNELMTKLSERKQKPALSQRDRRNISRLRKVLSDMRSKTSFYFLHMSRLRRLCRALDNYEDNGPFMRNIFQPVKDADVQAKLNFTAVMEGGIVTFKELGIDVPAMFTEVKDIGIKDKLSTAERIGVWALAQNKKTLRHLRSEFSQEEIDKISKSVEDNENEMLVAAEIQTYFELGWDQLSKIADMHGIKGVVKEENYITAFIKRTDEVADAEFMEGLLQEFTTGKFVPGQQHTIARKRGAKRNLELNVFMIHARAAKAIERFKVMAPVADSVGSILKHGGFKDAINNATYGHGAKLFQKWLQDSIRGRSAYDAGPLSSTLRWLRMRSVHYVLGFKVLTAAKQGISLFPAAAVHPGMIPLITANLAHVPFGSTYNKMKAEAWEKSDVLRTRDWNRDLRQVYNQKTVQKMYAGKKLSPMLMRMATTVDGYTVTVVWTSAYQLAQRQGMDEADSVAFADGVVQNTQPMGGAVDLPSFFRGSELEKNFSIFQNQVNQNGNMFWYDILGETKARKISLPMMGYRLLMSQFLPAILLGMVSRGRPPEDLGELGKDLAFYLLSPYFVIGRLIYNMAIAREWGPTSGFLFETPITETYRATGALMKGDLGKTLKYGARATGAWTGGLPPLQVIQTTEGAWNLATGETEDFRELIWSKYALKKKGKKGGRKKGYYTY